MLAFVLLRGAASRRRRRHRLAAAARPTAAAPSSGRIRGAPTSDRFTVAPGTYVPMKPTEGMGMPVAGRDRLAEAVFAATASMPHGCTT